MYCLLKQFLVSNMYDHISYLFNLLRQLFSRIALTTFHVRLKIKDFAFPLRAKKRNAF